MSASPIDDYLDEVLARLRGEPSSIRRVLAEVEDHLRSSAAEAVAGGLDEAAAEHRAVDRFGSPRLVAGRFGTEWSEPTRCSRSVRCAARSRSSPRLALWPSA